MDLIADYDKATGKSAIKLNLNLSNIPDTLTGELKFAYSDADSKNQVVKVAASKELKTADDKLVGFEVTLEGLHSGASEVTATYGGYTARLMVTVTADLRVVLKSELVKNNRVELTLNPPKPPTEGTITPSEGGAGNPAGEDPSAEGPTEPAPPTGGTTPAPEDTTPEGGETTPTEPAPPTYEPSEPATVTLKLFDTRDNEIKADKPTLTWEAECEDPKVAKVTINADNTITVTGLEKGEARIGIMATYKEYTAKGSLSVTVKEPDTQSETGKTG